MNFCAFNCKTAFEGSLRASFYFGPLAVQLGSETDRDHSLSQKAAIISVSIFVVQVPASGL